MKENKDSQRWAVTELLEVIANLIASYSHHYELYNNIQVDLSNPELFDKEQIEEMINKSKWHYDKLVYLLLERRNAMRLLKEMAKEYDWDCHCILKHSIALFQFASELLNTDMDNLDYINLAENSSKYMYECASKYLWVDIVKCWRCLLDSLSE